MADYIRDQDQGVPRLMRTRYRDMGDNTHALVIAATIPDQEYDGVTGGIVGIDSLHHEIHEGEFYSLSYKTPDANPIADNATLAFVLTTTTKYCHFQAVGACGGDAEMEFYEGSTITGGTASTSYNHKRYSTETTTVTVVRDPTVNTAGTLLEHIMLPGGFGPRSIGSVGNQRQEWILKLATKYLVRLTNRSGSNQASSLMLTWYEESNP